MPENTKASALRTMIMFLVLTSFIQASCSQNIAFVINGTVTKVLSGDVFQIITSVQTKLWGRLYGVDAPETFTINPRNDAVIPIDQPYGDASRTALGNKILGQTVHLSVIKMDNHHRLVAIVWLDERNINLEMVRDGYAEALVESIKPPYRSAFLEAQQEAKSNRLGIWSFPRYERPGDFRKRFNMPDEEE